MRLINKQKGFTLTPALLIIVLILMAGVTYLIYIKNMGKAVMKIERSQTAKSIAEIGLNHFKSQIAKVNYLDTGSGIIYNKWFNTKALDGSNLFPSSSQISNYIDVKDKDNNIIGKYRLTLENGEFVSGLKTITNSLIEGVDRYGNKIWDNLPSNKNYHKDEGFYRYGVKVEGNINTEKQSIYAVIDVPTNTDISLISNSNFTYPSGYLISTNGFEAGITATTDRYLTLIGGQLITGKVHSNNRIDFSWNANFDIFNPDRPNSINEKYTATQYRFPSPYLSDPSPIFISDVVREVGQSSTQMTIYGTNFGLSASDTKISINGSAEFSPTTAVQGQQIVPPSTTPTLTSFATKLQFSLPSGTATSYTIDVRSVSRGIAIRYVIDEASIKNNVPVPAYIPPLKIYGLMQVNDRRGFLSQQVYTQTTDYRFIGPPAFPGFNAPYIAWDPTGIEPAGGAFYEATYITEKNIPHNKIKVFDNITYSGYVNPTNLPNLYYIHAHKAPGTSSYPWSSTHSHGEIFGISGVSLTQAVKPTDYLTSAPIVDWGHQHRHQVTPNILTTDFKASSDLFFKWGVPDINDDASNSLKPSPASSKIAPILAPNNVNYTTQRMYANQIIKIIYNKNLSKDSNDYFNSLNEIPDDRENGYYDLKGGMLDLRSTYFGNDLKYSSGGDVLPINSKITDTATIFVNDNPNSGDYLRVESSALNSDYHAYIYRQIPKNSSSVVNGQLVDSGIIFVRDGVIRIGGANYKGNVTSTLYTNTLGYNTIIDGRLTIVSYTEEKPTTYIDNSLSNSTDNKGDIVITGNIIYRNKISPWESDVVKSDYNHNGFRQMDRDSSNFVTNNDGSPVSSLPPSQKVNGLALIASNDIKIPVGHYNHSSTLENHYTTTSEETSSNCPCKNTLTISAQLVAGHKLTQTRVGDNEVSKNDRLILYGSIYSYLPPNLSYFDRTDPNNREEQGLGRIYLYDKTLDRVQLAGTPSFPINTNYANNFYPVIGLNLPRIVPGTWKVVTDGAQ
ncbi:MAG: hypothetical protein U0354_08310 [Candidatus Sericytochromatia bacterium]